MKKTLFVFIVALVMSLTSFTAAAQIKTFKAYQAAVMMYDNNGDEIGWSEWVKSTYSMTLNANNDMVTLNFDRTAKLHAYDFDDWEVNEDGNLEYTLYCTDTKTGQEADITFVLLDNNEMLVILEDDEVTLGLKVRDASEIKNYKGKKGTRQGTRRRH